MTRREELAALPLHDRIAAVVEDSGLGQEEFADEIGAPRETISRWVNRHARPGRGYRLKLAEQAERIYGGKISPDLFREYVTDRSQPIEEAAAQLGRTAELLQEALAALRDAGELLVPLLQRQEQLVVEMHGLVAELRRFESASRQRGASR